MNSLKHKIQDALEENTQNLDDLVRGIVKLVENLQEIELKYLWRYGVPEAIDRFERFGKRVQDLQQISQELRSQDMYDLLLFSDELCSFMDIDSSEMTLAETGDRLERLQLFLVALSESAQVIADNGKEIKFSKTQRAVHAVGGLRYIWQNHYNEKPTAWKNEVTGELSPFVRVVNLVLDEVGEPQLSHRSIHSLLGKKRS